MRVNFQKYKGKTLREKKIEDLMLGKLKVDYPDSKEILKEKKLPAWCLDNLGNLYLIIGEIGIYNSYCSIVFPEQKTSSIGFLYIDKENPHSRLDVPALGWLTIPVPEKRKAVQRKLSLLRKYIRENNLIGKALWKFHSPRCPVKLFRMNIRGLYSPTLKELYPTVFKKEKRK